MLHIAYTVGEDKLPDQDCAVEAAELMQEALVWAEETPYVCGVKFYGEVYEHTKDPKQFKVINYIGRVTGIIVEPPSFTLKIDEAALQIGDCDCPTVDTDDIFENLEQTLDEAELSAELDEFAGVETKDPHYQELPVLAGTEVALRFDRLGAYLVCGAVLGLFE